MPNAILSLPSSIQGSSMKIDFNNTEVAFRTKTDNDLKQSYLLFKTLASPQIVSVGKGLTKASFALGLPIKGIIKKTVFRQFCGGETIEECGSQVNRLMQYKVHAILDYSAEGKESEAEFDHCMDITLQTIEYAVKNPGVPLAVFKPTGIARFALLEKMNKNQNLSANEQLEWDRVMSRFHRIAKTASDLGIPVMVDAEESWIQDIVDRVVADLMLKYNKEKAVIYNTIQFYRRNRVEFLEKSIQHARENGYFYGVKIVRGAYMEKERERALEMGYADPIQPDKASSDRDYNKAIRLILENIDITRLVCGTHNDESSQLLVDLMSEKGLAPGDERIWFAQLFGMSDHLSFNLSEKGFHVVKYLPFGPVKDVMPYLFRRAEENTSVRGQTGRELSLIQKELKRRKK